MTEATNIHENTVLLVGNPNSGKSTIFNQLTGIRQQTGNYPGITTEKKSGRIEVRDSSCELVDLPGLYSLNPRTDDEKVSVKVIQENVNARVIYIADSLNLKRSLLLFSQLPQKNKLLVLNKADLLKSSGKVLNTEILKENLGAHVVQTNAKAGRKDVRKILGWLIDGDKASGFNFQSEGVINRFIEIDKILDGVVEHSSSKEKRKLDGILLHRFWGWIESLFSFGQDLFGSILPEGVLRDLITEGIIPGLGGVLVFIPQIALLFFFIGILEHTGYMSRAAHLMDGLMRKFGMNGKSVLPLVSGFACAVPAIMATRTIEGWKQRVVTMFVLPFTTCSARLPVYILLIEAFIPDDTYLGFISMKGLTMTILYLLGIGSALIVGFIMSKLVNFKSKDLFVFELPKMQVPNWKDIGMNIWSKSKIFVWEAGRIIFVLSIVLWFLASYGPGDDYDNIPSKYDNSVLTEMETKQAIRAEQLEKSYLGIAGNTIEPLIAPLGFDWKMGIGLIASFAAREVMVGSMATIYGVADEGEEIELAKKIRNERTPEGELKFSVLNGISLMIFYAFALQCMSTLAVMKRETGSWKWPLFQFVFMTGLAYLACLIFYQSFS
jgi:ferrous iron transport protein B